MVLIFQTTPLVLKSLGPIALAEHEESSQLPLELVVIARNLPCILLGLHFKWNLLMM
jgi:hypothetical protein